MNRHTEAERTDVRQGARTKTYAENTTSPSNEERSDPECSEGRARAARWPRARALWIERVGLNRFAEECYGDSIEERALREDPRKASGAPVDGFLPSASTLFVTA